MKHIFQLNNAIMNTFQLPEMFPAQKIPKPIITRQLPIRKHDPLHRHPSIPAKSVPTLRCRVSVHEGLLPLLLLTSFSLQLVDQLNTFNNGIREKCTDCVDLVPPGHESKIVIEDSPGPDYRCCESSEPLHSFLELVEPRGW